MRTVEQRLAQRETAEPAQTEQRQIVTDLSQLIDELAAKQPGRAQQQAQSGRKPDPTGDNKTGQQAAQDSTPGAPQAAPGENSAQDMENALGAVWGHLPERYRRHVQNAGTVEFLPQYRKLIEDYYRRLSEERDNKQ